RVENAGGWYERARAHGARVLEPPTDREYGERECTVEDLAGHRWQFTETVRDVAPEEYGCQTVAPWPERGPNREAPNICRPARAGRPAPGCLLSSSGCTVGTQPPGETGQRLACQEMTRPRALLLSVANRVTRRRASPPLCSASRLPAGLRPKPRTARSARP